MVCIIEFTRDIRHHGQNLLGMVHGFIEDSLELHLALADERLESIGENKFVRTQERGQHMVVQVKEFT